MEELKLKKVNINIDDVIKENTLFITYIFVYIAGLLVGSFAYKAISTVADNELLSKIFVISTSKFLDIFFSRLCIYLGIFLITILISLCVIGYPVIFIIPFLVGFEIAVKLAFFYNMYNYKGFGYSLLIIIPESAIYILVLCYTINTAGELSKNLMNIAKNNKISRELPMKNYFQKFLVYGSETIVISLVNSLLIYVFNSLIQI